MSLSGKVEGITSDKIARLKEDILGHEAEGLKALIEFYATELEDGRTIADEKLNDAYKRATSARHQLEGLNDLQTDHQAKRHDIAAWLEHLVAEKDV